MTRTETTGNLIVRAKERADMENSSFISDAEWYRGLNVWTAKLWNHLVKADPDRYTREQTIFGDGTTLDHFLSAVYYGTVGVDYISDSTRGIYIELPRLIGPEENRISQLTPGRPLGYTFRYNVDTPSNQELRILPVMDSSSSVRHRWIVEPPKYATDGSQSGDLVLGIAGFEEFIVIGMAIDARIKEESSVVQLRESLQEIKMHLEEMAENRTIDDAGHVHSVRTTHHLLDPAGVRWGGRG